MNILKVISSPDEALEGAFSTTQNTLVLGQQQHQFSAVFENSLPDSLLQNLSSEPASIVLTGSCGKLSSLKEIFAQYVQLDSTVFVSACEVKRDGIVDLLHISNVKNYAQSIPLERQLKKVKLSEAIVRLVSKRHSNSSYGISSCLIVNLYTQGMITSIIDLNTRTFYDTFAKGTMFPMVEKLIFKPSSHFVLHLNKNADSATVAASLDEFNDTQNLFMKKHTLIKSNPKPATAAASTAPRRSSKTALPGYARPTISSRRPAIRASGIRLAGKVVGKPYTPRSISRETVHHDISKHAKAVHPDVLKNTKDAFIQTISGLKQSLAQIKSGTVQEIHRELAFTRQNLDQMMSKFISQGNTISELESTVAEQNVKIQELQSRYDQKCQESMESETAHSQLESTQALLKNSNNALASLQEKHQSVEHSYKDTMEKLQALEQVAESQSTLRAEVEALQQTNSIQEKNLSKLTSILEEKETLIVELRGLQKINDSLEAHKNKADKELSELKKQSEHKLKELEEKEQKHRQDLEVYKKSIGEYQQELQAQKNKAHQQHELIEAHVAKESRQEAKITELNEIINRTASFEYPELDFTKINYPLTNSPTIDFTQEFGNENEGAFKKPTLLKSPSPLRMSNDINISHRFDSVVSKRIGKESSMRTSLPKTFSEDITLH